MKKFIPALCVHAVYLLVLISWGFFTHAVAVFNDYFSGSNKLGGNTEYMIFYAITIVLPIVVLLVFRNLKGLFWGYIIALLYVAVDFSVIKPSLPGCQDMCGLENMIFGVLLLIATVITAILRFLMRSTSSSPQPTV
ncbi:MAG: hypothetical protein K0S38_524 [Candidatus Paceibacter sp.]|nr:hypothetical protein [Candidatus Paceibacter sp.]